MGIRNTRVEPESPELTEEKVRALENSIKVFIEEQKDNIKSIFNDKDLTEQTIEYVIDGNNEILKEGNVNPLKCLKDYSIQWSIKGNNEVNSTKCHLTFFNIGGLLGANGLLFSICEFYYFFSKIQSENRQDGDIIQDIEKCLKLIDEGKINELNIIWRANINQEILNDLRMAKDYLINLFHEKVTNDIFDNINDNIVTKIMKKCVSLGKGVSKFLVYILYLLSFQLSGYKQRENAKNEYVKYKNSINKYNLSKILLNKINMDFFSQYNIFVLASDDNTIPLKNLGVAFTGMYIQELGEMNRARRLIENEKDGFMTGNNVNNNNKKLYNFYCQKINDIKWFFERNRDSIYNIMKGIYGKDNYFINQLAKELDLVNESNLHEGVIDVLENSYNISTQRTTQYTQYNNLDGMRENGNEDGIFVNNMMLQRGSKEHHFYNKLKEEMGENRAAEYFRIQRNLENNNYNNAHELINTNVEENYANANQDYVDEKKESLIEESY